MAKVSFAVVDVLIVGLFYCIGAVFYSSKVPERWFPGKFDLIGHSHQIWHLFVLAAAFWHFNGIYKTFLFWHEHNATCLVTDESLIAMFN